MAFHDSVRPLRILKDANEVYRCLIARRAFEGLEEAGLEPVTDSVIRSGGGGEKR